MALEAMIARKRAGRVVFAHPVFPTKPPAYARNGVTPNMLIDFTPALHDQALISIAVLNRQATSSLLKLEALIWSSGR